MLRELWTNGVATEPRSFILWPWRKRLHSELYSYKCGLFCRDSPCGLLGFSSIVCEMLSFSAGLYVELLAN